MFARLRATGKAVIPTASMNHDIKCIVNGAATPFTMANDEVHCFGLFDSRDRLVGYFGNQGLVPEIRDATYIDGFMEPMVTDAPEGCYVKSVSRFYKSVDPKIYYKVRTLH
ncbi:hypothetical protein ST201phi2-1p459 [Pseudomonas phage 201phi2-1]|uniref:Uncharacterized protein n=1 Tax=Pseudomonas phage 201phi2-1 TaxID=198110 RepID=B3FJW7_BP201|nr:hypothetical protein ST201phi2-1p459 [Pseudomonas phage 201phi2-1]ABY63282.1 hypothetical protein 201phi2-1p459 [Pseudomonas phage 201phi2-1]